jgi:hypothetical protein
MGSKTLPTIWGTYMKLVTKYQISAINSCWEKRDDKCLGRTEGQKDRRTEVKQYTLQDIFRHIFLSNYWWQRSDIWSQASYRYLISWEAFLDPSDSYPSGSGGIISNFSAIQGFSPDFETISHFCRGEFFLLIMNKQEYNELNLIISYFALLVSNGDWKDPCIAEKLLIIPPLPEGGGGYTVLPLSVRPRYFSSHFSQ